MVKKVLPFKSIVARPSQTLLTSLRVARLVGKGMDLNLESVLLNIAVFPPKRMV